jgi:SAM-dependent methyltransferase
MTGAALRRPHIHPFPARMAPEVALEKIRLLTDPGDAVLDPMCGSGTVVRQAAELSRRGIGADLDPLAVLITRTTCTPSWSTALRDRAEAVVREARIRSGSLPDWIERDEESRLFVSYWFAKDQLGDLARLSQVLRDRPRRDDPLRVALSRLIVTKEGGASLARDTAHSRPHRVREVNDFDVFTRYLEAASKLERLAEASVGSRVTSVRRADARNLGFVRAGSIDLVLTSPPYLNAIDYVRGHRLSLVWLGFTVGELRRIRSETIGARRRRKNTTPKVVETSRKAVPRFDDLPETERPMVLRFVGDMDRLYGSLGRILKRGGHLVIVVADSQVRGVPVPNSAICRLLGGQHGFEVVEQTVRPLPTRHRYLPPPNATVSTLSQRMKEEAIITFRKV